MSVPLARRIRGFLQRRVPLMITCREFEDFIVDYLDGALSWRQRFVFQSHLVLCRECRDYLGSYERAIALGKVVLQHPDEAVPEEIPEDLVRAILSARKAGQE
jgi:predicted anti-sigma-YlaC factor YlaD